ncbi:hypothetical protein GP486_003853 [Trichoglossum hirsutum]|uniref:Mechanosensitive ion channel protein Msy1/2-like transmembrane domain-containing protein n=1 Tax=Trichoglossum hirsutum TaxID=265104 RepID=A0A9P8LCB2_9PEZI|nr:hypothetical protein GP486_003853 [Trichoglossum hirsutum]
MSGTNGRINYAQGRSAGDEQDRGGYTAASPYDVELGIGFGGVSDDRHGRLTNRSTRLTNTSDDREHPIKKVKRLRVWVWWAAGAALLAIPLTLFATKFSSSRIGGIRLLGLLIWLEVIWFSLWSLYLFTWVISTLWHYLCQKEHMDMSLYGRFFHGIRRSLMVFLLAIVAWASMQPLSCRFNHGKCTGKWIDRFQKMLLSLLIVATILLIKSVLVEIVITRSAVNLFVAKTSTLERALHALRILQEVIRDRSGEPPQLGSRSRGRNRPPLYQLPTNFLEWLLVKTLLPAEDDRTRDEIEELFWKGVESSSTLDSAKSGLLDIEELTTYGEAKFRNVQPLPLTAAEIFCIFAVKDRERKTINIEEWEMVNVGALKASKHIKNGIKGIRNAVSSVDRSLSGAVLVGSLILVYAKKTALFYPDKFSTFWTLAWTTFTGLSFALSGTATEIFLSCAFVFAKQPYGVGDHVTIDGKELIVDEIHLTHTTFRGITNGAADQISHAQLSTGWITNHYRSRDLKGLKLTTTTQFYISPAVGFERIQRIADTVRQGLCELIAKDPPCSYYFSDVQLKILPTASEGVHNVQLVMPYRYVVRRTPRLPAEPPSANVSQIIPLDPVDKGRTHCRGLVMDRLYELMQAETSAALKESRNPAPAPIPGTPSTAVQPGTPQSSVYAS